MIVQLGPPLLVDVGPLHDVAQPGVELTIAAAVPKGDRADWMIEKLCELGVTAFIPLEAARSVVLPTGKGKSDRWHRIAIEAAKQSRRPGVMTIAPLAKVADVLGQPGEKRVASTGPMTRPLIELATVDPLIIFIGPEGGWTDAELAQFDGAGVPQVSLTPTVLRIETAAVTAAAVLLCRNDLSR